MDGQGLEYRDHKHVSQRSLLFRWGQVTMTLVLVAAIGAFGSSFERNESVAAQPACGSTITASVTLRRNLGPCSQGLLIFGSNIVFNLAGHSITGVQQTNQEVSGITGVSIEGSSDTVRDGSISGFFTGVVLEETTNATIENLRLSNNGLNAEAAIFYGGIDLFSSTNTTVTENSLTNDGIGVQVLGMPGVGMHNVLTSNTLVRNHVGIGVFQQNTTEVLDNRIIDSQGQGVEVFQSPGSIIEGNVAVGNSPDLTDFTTTPPCGSDVWNNNIFSTANQSCIR
jgi:nitrous oxidase accessory protein NosD